MNLLIMTPMQPELNLFVQSCAGRGLQAEKAVAGRLPVVRLPELGVTLARGGTGKAQFAVQAQYLLDTGPDWELVICAGAAGGLVDDVSIGDVVVATTTVEHDYNNKFNDRPLPRFAGDLTTIACLRRVSLPSPSFKVHFGPVASGDEDVIDPVRRKSLQHTTDALAVAWEGAGGARACAFSQVPFVEMRGITDTANHQASAEFETNLAVAMHHLATFITVWISQMASRNCLETSYPTRTKNPGFYII